MRPSPTVFLASCDLTDVFEVEVDDDDDALAAALAEAGCEARIVHWDDPDVDWGGADAVLVRSVWNYLDRREELIAWAQRVAEVTHLLPAADVVRWNTHKSYLLELEDRGVPIVPTAWLGRGDEVDLAALAASRGWSAVVAKPAVGAGSVGLLVARDPGVHQDEFAALCARHDVLVQPLLEEVASRGELSVVVIDGACSHAVRKLPVAGDVRVQVEFGGRYEPVEVRPETARLAEWVVEGMGTDALLARVDLLADADGTWQVLEVELVDPALFLGWVPDAADRVAAAVMARLG